MRIAIVVPTLNEERALARYLPAALAAVATSDEVVVSDGGSEDGTLAVAHALGVRTVVGPPGRGVQLNRGAAATGAPVVLFLHADTALPAGALDRVRRAVAAGAAGGGFLLRFDAELAKLRLGARLINWRTRLTRLPLGDQAQFATRAAFEKLGGFRDWPILEDLDLMWRLQREPGGVALVDDPVTTSARRFVERGAARTVATNWLIWLLFALGVPPARLAGLYRQIR
jgi:rSAM/selenodomain-associated transferase 2